MVLAAGTAFFGAEWGFAPLASPRFVDSVIAFAILSVLSDASSVKLRIGRGATDSSIAFIPFIASILLFETGWAMFVATSSVFVIEQFVRQKPEIKVLFNASQNAVSVWAASSVFHALGGVPSFSPHAVLSASGTITFSLNPVAAAGTIAVYFLVNISAVSAVVSLADRIPLRDAWVRIAGSSLLYDLFTSTLGLLLAYLYVRSGLLGVVVLILPLYFVRHIYKVNMQLEEINRELLDLMVKAIEARDPYTSGHSLRVSQVASQIAKDSGLGHKLAEQITTAALLHDVGKIYEDFAPLLRKGSRLDATEKALMQTHPTRSAELVATISGFRGIIEQAVRHHHENFDGSGYPSGLSGRAIPIGARIIMIADTMDAMTTDRPYRKALTYERVIQELQRFSGRQFDPQLVERVVNSNSIRSLVTDRIASQSQAGSGALAVLANQGANLATSQTAAR